MGAVQGGASVGHLHVDAAAAAVAFSMTCLREPVSSLDLCTVGCCAGSGQYVPPARRRSCCGSIVVRRSTRAVDFS